VEERWSGGCCLGEKNSSREVRLQDRSEAREGGAAPLKDMGLGLGFSFLYSSNVSKLPPILVCVEDQYL
jgi:hypothetical protein